MSCDHLKYLSSDDISRQSSMALLGRGRSDPCRPVQGIRPLPDWVDFIGRCHILEAQLLGGEWRVFSARLGHLRSDR